MTQTDTPLSSAEMRGPLESSAGQTFGAEHARPFVEWQIAVAPRS
jgi:hypothetical protein